MEAFSYNHPSCSTQSEASTLQRLGLLLLCTLLQSHITSSASNATNINATLNNNETCNNVTIYNAIREESVPFLQVKLNLTSHQLQTNVYDVMKTFNNLYDDQTIGFVHANDLSVNNDVCRQMIRTKLSPSSGSFLKCPWEYKCDYDPRRIPQVMWQADCSQYSTWQCPFSDFNTGCISINRKCKSIFYPVPILYNDISCSPFCKPGNWSWREQNVAVACACSEESEF